MREANATARFASSFTLARRSLDSGKRAQSIMLMAHWDVYARTHTRTRVLYESCDKARESAVTIAEQPLR